MGFVFFLFDVTYYLVQNAFDVDAGLNAWAALGLRLMDLEEWESDEDLDSDGFDQRGTA